MLNFSPIPSPVITGKWKMARWNQQSTNKHYFQRLTNPNQLV